MILVTGGLGFIGLHTARALLDLGESCVLTRHRTARHPDLIKDERILVEQLDVTDRSALLALGSRHEITGIVHLAAPGHGTLNPVESARTNIQGLLNVLEAGQEWGVRVGVASSIGIYLGVQESPFREDMPLSMVGTHPIETIKKTFELLDTFIAAGTGLDVVNFRISAVWGPLGRAESRFFAAPGLVHAAAGGAASDGLGYADDGIDMCYVKDCGRAIALLQTAEKLNHRTYNVGSGGATRNAEVVAAIKKVVPEADLRLRDGRTPGAADQDPYLDLTRIRQDTGYQPAYDVERGVADYVGWLRAGNER